MCQDEQSKLDNAILCAAETSWNKVAMIISRVATRLPDKLGDDEDRHLFIANRIGQLVNEGRLLVQGDIHQWRNAEICLP